MARKKSIPDRTVGTPEDDATPSEPNPPMGEWYKLQMRFGCHIASQDREITPTEWRTFEREAILPHFPNGYSIDDGRGGWRDVARGQPYAERTKTLIVLTQREKIDSGDPDLIDKLQIPRLLRTAAVIAAEYKRRFSQDAVLVYGIEVVEAGFW
jgi:hypothetical protein